MIRLHLVPHLGHLRLADRREEHLTQLYRRLARPSGPLGETMVHHVHTVLGTGLEAAVRRGAIPRNAARATVTVTGNLVVGYSGGAERDDPKTAAARRTVRIPEVAAAALRATPRRGILVFPSARSEGPMLASTLLRQHFRPLLAKAGLPPMPFHDLRHTAATHVLEDGVPPHVVARVLGHANVGVTLGIYAHVTGAMTDAAALAMDVLERARKGYAEGYGPGLKSEIPWGPP